MGGFGDDIDYDYLEDQLNNLPPRPRHAIAVQASGLNMRKTARALKRSKKRANKQGKPFLAVNVFEARRPKESVDGWIRSDSSYTPEDEKSLRKFFEKYFAPKGLTVGEIRCEWYGITMSIRSYDMLEVIVRVT